MSRAGTPPRRARRTPDPEPFVSQAFPATTAARLLAALAAEHEREPFTPRAPRAAVRRVVAVATRLELAAVAVRGNVDVGGAELDHLWASVEDRVVDVALPVRSPDFVAVLRAYVAGDLAGDDLDRAAAAHPLEARVVGAFPGTLHYIGRPVWSSRRAGG